METINDILRDMRNANFQPPWYQKQVNLYIDRIEAAHKREMKHLVAHIYGVASWIWGLISTSMARERGISASEVRNIAVKLEVLADKAEVK